MLVFSISDKGGTGRSVTSSNVAYRRALAGLDDVCYLDFDFGSPTAGAIFGIGAAVGTIEPGLHSYLQGETSEPTQYDVWTSSSDHNFEAKPTGAKKLVFYPGDLGGGEFPITDEIVRRCVQLFLRLDEEFGMVIVDLSAGRSYAVQLALQAIASSKLQQVEFRWLVFHRWTRQHIEAAHNLVHGTNGLLESSKRFGLSELSDSLRYVRTAVIVPPEDGQTGVGSNFSAWLKECNEELGRKAAQHRLGLTVTLGQVPLDPILQWREQVISNGDCERGIANQATVDAFVALSEKLSDSKSWEIF